MRTELEAAVRRLEAVADGGLVALPDESAASLEGDIAIVLAALSTPPADDVREALVDAMVLVEVSNGMVEFADEEDDRADARHLADAILDRFEVRPRGTVTESPRPYSEAVDIEHGAWETDDIEERAHDLLAVVAHRRAEATREAEEEVSRAEQIADSVELSRGTFTDAGVTEIANRAQEATGISIWPRTVRAVLEAAREVRL